MSTELPFYYTNYEGLYEGFLIRIDMWMQTTTCFNCIHQVIDKFKQQVEHYMLTEKYTSCRQVRWYNKKSKALAYSDLKCTVSQKHSLDY